jgi:hypothetical protein
MLSPKGKIIAKRAWKSYLIVTKVWFYVKPHAIPWGVNKGPINKQACEDFSHQRWKLPSKFAKKYEQATKKKWGYQRSSPCMLNLQTIKHALQAKCKWSNPKEEGSSSPTLVKVMAKKYIGHIPETYHNLIVISYIPCWIGVEGMRHMTEGRHGDGSSSSERSRWNVNPLYTYITRKLKYKAKSCW